MCLNPSSALHGGSILFAQKTNKLSPIAWEYQKLPRWEHKLFASSKNPAEAAAAHLQRGEVYCAGPRGPLLALTPQEGKQGARRA